MKETQKQGLIIKTISKSIEVCIRNYASIYKIECEKLSTSGSLIGCLQFQPSDWHHSAPERLRVREARKARASLGIGGLYIEHV